MTLRLAVFDCDGTLTDGQAAVCEAMELAFTHASMPPPPRHKIRRIVGLSLPQAVRHLAETATAEQQAQIVDAYKSAFRDARAAGRLHEPLYDGIADLLRRLHEAGWVLGVATGKSDRGLAATLAANDLSPLFSTLHTADRHPSKPDPAMILAAMADVAAAPEQTVMIGDTVYDMHMAQNAGCRAIGVGWGYHASAELIEAGAIGVARDMAELESLLHE